MATLIPDIRQQYFDADGLPLAGGKIYTYAAGTTTPLATYTDATGDTANTNPIVLDANGEGDIWIGPLAYKFVIQDSSGVTLKTIDGVIILPDGSVTAEKILDGEVINSKLAAKVVTPDKMADVNIDESSIDIGTVTSTTPAAATGSRSFIGTGRPIAVELVGVDDSGAAKFKVSGPNTTPAVAQIDIYRDTTLISSQQFGVERDTAGTPLETITATGSWVATFTGLATFEGCGGGGGGGGADNSDSGGGGGGAGAEFGSHQVYVTEGTTYTITVGAGGTGGTGSAGGNDGSAGGNTTVADGTTVLITWKGGAGGKHGVNSGGAGGDGGAAYFFGGSGGNGGVGSTPPGAGVAGTTGKHPRSAAGGAGGTANPANHQGAGGGGGGSLGAGAVGQNNGAGSSPAAPGYGGGGYGAGASNASITSGGAGGAGIVYIYDGSSIFGATHSASIPVSAFRVVDTGAIAGAHTYTIQTSVTNAAATLTQTGEVDLRAYEL